MQRTVIPIGHSRQSLHKRLGKYLKCKQSTREVAFEPVLKAFNGAYTIEEVLDDVPLEAMEAVTW